MKRTKEILKVLFTILCMLFAFSSISFAATTGIYETADGTHKIEVKEDGTILYDDAYSLTLTEIETGDKLTGSIGSDKKAVTLYELDDSTWVSYAAVTYKHNSVTTYLYEYTAFYLDGFKPTVTENGIYEVWSGDVKVNSYADLQNAVSAAESGETVKITSGDKVTSGAYINKVITIDGCGNILDKSSWANSVFVVEKGATLNLENITIDGGAPGFEVDYDAVTFTNFTIPLKADSATNDFLSNASVIISKGDLNANNIELNNNYIAKNGAAVSISKGNANFVNSTFYHNRASAGAGVFLGSAFESDQIEYSVGKVTFDNCNFEKNYAGNGSAIYVLHTEDISISNTDFISNTVTGGYGGAIHVTRTNSSKRGALPFTKVKIDESLFEGNWTGNDGFAIQNYDADFTITNTTFRKNVGTHPSSSVGTFSCQVSARGELWSYQVLRNCLFEENEGPASCIGDHGGQEFINVYDTTFKGNKGNSTALYYTGCTTYERCTFIEEEVTSGAIRIVPNDYSAYYKGSGYEGPYVVIKDTIFENTSSGCDLYLYTYNGSADFVKTNALIEGDCVANIRIRHNNAVTIEGNNTGDIVVDYDTPLSNAVISEQGNLYGQIINNTLYVTYPSGDTSATKQIPAEEEIKASSYYIQELLGIENEGYMLGLYTDAEYTTAWDGIVVKGTSLYAKWEEHPTHTLSEELSIEQNRIVKACECGYFEGCLMMEAPTNLVYDGNLKEVSVINTLELLETEYTLEYKQSKDSDWELLTSAPSNVGSYKAVLTVAGDKAIELEYEITKATPVIKMSNLSQKNVSITPVTYTITPTLTDGTVKVEYKESTAEDTSYTETLPTLAGTYSVRITLTGDSNLEDAEKVETLKITKRTSNGSSSVTKYEIKVTDSEGGMITPSTYSVKEGSDKTFKIEAEEGYEIEDVLVDGESVGIVESYTFENVKEKHTIEAKFKKIEEEQEWENPFADVNEDDWFYEAVKFTNENKLINGMTENEFGGKISTTRGMIVTILYRYAKAETTEESTFEDVAKGSYYSNAIAWAAKNGIVNGMGDNKFAPDAEITREQLVTILHRFAMKNEMDVSVGENTNILSYDDFSEISEYAIPAFQWACGSGIITGRTESTLAPIGTATRAEVATMLMRFCENI